MYKNYKVITNDYGQTTITEFIDCLFSFSPEGEVKGDNNVWLNAAKRSRGAL